ncbi:MAG: malate synthase A [Polyangiaceae bacterium]
MRADERRETRSAAAVDPTAAAAESGADELELAAPPPSGTEHVLSDGAKAFVAKLAHRFASRVDVLLRARAGRREAFIHGEPLGFLRETEDVRRADWKVESVPAALLDRRVEITGPVDRKMVINALSAGASCFMADFEDSTSPTWENLLRGQANLIDAIAGTIAYDDPTTGKHYELAAPAAGAKPTTLLVRPRGLHLVERHARIASRAGGLRAIPACVFYLGLFLFHNARALAARSTGPFFYFPKLEGHLEAQLVDDLLAFAEEQLGLAKGTCKVTVLIETLPAAFEMDEILYALRGRSSGLNCGRWDYIFSSIKTLRADPAAVFPDRSLVTMEQPMMKAYSELLIQTCHRRGAHAMGGMAAQIPIKRDADANARAMDRVRADKLREAKAGHDGTWVAHPGLIPIAKEIFDAQLQSGGAVGRVNQLDVARADVRVGAADLVRIPEGARTIGGLRHNVRVGVQYIEAWLRGVGCVPLYDLMEDAATAEISRTQVWQWLRHGASIDGEPLTEARVRTVVDEEMNRVREEVGEARFGGGRFPEAIDLFTDLVTRADLPEFLTTLAYERLP